MKQPLAEIMEQLAELDRRQAFQDLTTALEQLPEPREAPLLVALLLAARATAEVARRPQTPNPVSSGGEHCT